MRRITSPHFDPGTFLGRKALAELMFHVPISGRYGDIDLPHGTRRDRGSHLAILIKPPGLRIASREPTLEGRNAAVRTVSFDDRQIYLFATSCAKTRERNSVYGTREPDHQANKSIQTPRQCLLTPIVIPLKSPFRFWRRVKFIVIQGFGNH